MKQDSRIIEIVDKYDIELMLTFGSYGTERFTSKSDIDVGFLSRTPMSDGRMMELLRDLIVFFHRDGIDLVDLNKASPLLQYEVACNSKVMYEENDSYLRFIVKAGGLYADTEHLRIGRRQYLKDALDNLGGDIRNG